jgi:hypothetical protein
MSLFAKHCQEVVSDYLQTAIIIDDQVRLSEPYPTKREKPTEQPVQLGSMFVTESIQQPIEVPVAIEQKLAANDVVLKTEPQVCVKSITNEPEIKKSTGVISALLSEDNQIDHFDATKATDAFYAKGIVAGLYRPVIKDGLNENQFASSVDKIARRSDVVIVDWMLKKGNSTYSKALVNKVLTNDIAQGGRLRTIIIYTGEPNITALIVELKDYLSSNGKIELENHDTYSLKNKNVIIAFYNKMGPTTTTRKIPEDKLPDIALIEFGKLINGIIPSLAMKASSTVRDNTSRIIAKFGNELDVGFLSHRALLPSPEDSEVFMLEKYVSYLRNILSISKVDSETLGINTLNKWVDQHYSESIKIKVKGYEKDLEFSQDDIKLTLDKGYSKLAEIVEDRIVKDKIPKTSKKDARAILTDSSNILKIMDVFSNTTNQVATSSEKLCILNSFRRTLKDIAEPKELPYLTQGTVIYSMGEEEYFVCVTPKCDTARIPTSREFSFAILDQNVDETFDLIVPSFDNDKSIPLLMNKKFYELRNISFSSGQQTKVIAKMDQKRICFTDDSNSKYRWVGDLEDMDIQKRVSEIVGNFNRVGIDEVEWMRRQ